MTELEKLAIKVCEYDIKKGQGGRRSKGNSSAYGMTLKYLISANKILLKNFANAVGLTPQAFNFIVNHSKQEDFNEAEIEKYCKVLGARVETFNALVAEVDKIMKERKNLNAEK